MKPSATSREPSAGAGAPGPGVRLKMGFVATASSGWRGYGRPAKGEGGALGFP